MDKNLAPRGSILAISSAPRRCGTSSRKVKDALDMDIFTARTTAIHIRKCGGNHNVTMILFERRTSSPAGLSSIRRASQPPNSEPLVACRGSRALPQRLEVLLIRLGPLRVEHARSRPPDARRGRSLRAQLGG
eukprot:757336-Pyramimonas_sp.AAC.1